jgi:hypothetical protein
MDSLSHLRYMDVYSLVDTKHSRHQHRNGFRPAPSCVSFACIPYHQALDSNVIRLDWVGLGGNVTVGEAR